MVLPFLISIAVLLIADIDAPRHGLIRVSPRILRVRDITRWMRSQTSEDCFDRIAA